MLEVLVDCGLQPKLLPGIDLARTKYEGALPVRYALLLWPLDENGVHAINQRLKVPNAVEDVSDVCARYRGFFSVADPGPEATLAFLKGADAFRRPERFADILRAAKLASPGFDAGRVERALAAANGVDAAAIAKASPPERVGRAVDEARLAAIARLK
jgi:tRNA nucleotidyltransferase (CCA-adding enzyme)